MISIEGEAVKTVRKGGRPKKYADGGCVSFYMDKDIIYALRMFCTRKKLILGELVNTLVVDYLKMNMVTAVSEIHELGEQRKLEAAKNAVLLEKKRIREEEKLKKLKIVSSNTISNPNEEDWL